jgi:hypothetical protein
MKNVTEKGPCLKLKMLPKSGTPGKTGGLNGEPLKAVDFGTA